MEKSSRTKLTTVLILAVVFGAGLTLGLAADRSLGAAPPDAATEEAAPEEARRRPMWQRVEPTEEQTMLIDSIIQTHRASMKALQKEFRDSYNPRYQAVIESTRESILGVMTPAQADEYRVLLDEYDQRRAERGSRENQE